MPFVEPSSPSPLYYIRSRVEAQSRLAPAPFGDPNVFPGIMPWLFSRPRRSFTVLKGQAGETAPGDPRVTALAKCLRLSGYDDIVLRVPFGGSRLRCDIVSTERPEISLMAYRLGGETLFDWRVNGKTYSRAQNVSESDSNYMPSDRQFEALEALLRLERPLPRGWHEYERMEPKPI